MWVYNNSFLNYTPAIPKDCGFGNMLAFCMRTRYHIPECV